MGGRLASIPGLFTINTRSVAGSVASRTIGIAAVSLPTERRLTGSIAVTSVRSVLESASSECVRVGCWLPISTITSSVRCRRPWTVGCSCSLLGRCCGNRTDDRRCVEYRVTGDARRSAWHGGTEALYGVHVVHLAVETDGVWVAVQAGLGKVRAALPRAELPIVVLARRIVAETVLCRSLEKLEVTTLIASTIFGYGADHMHSLTVSFYDSR